MHKITDHLFLSDLRGAQDIDLLKINEISHIVTIGKNLNPMYPKTFSYLSLPLAEETSENIGKHFNTSYKFIKNAI